MTILNKVITWVLNKKESKKDIITVAENDDLYKLVKTKMESMENETVLFRIKALEKIVLRLVNEMHNMNEENKTQRELLLHLSTNTEELLNAISGEYQYVDEESEDSTNWEEKDPKKVNYN